MIVVIIMCSGNFVKERHSDSYARLNKTFLSGQGASEGTRGFMKYPGWVQPPYSREWAATASGLPQMTTVKAGLVGLVEDAHPIQPGLLS
jgi:hypothetical protein